MHSPTLDELVAEAQRIRLTAAQIARVLKPGDPLATELFAETTPETYFLREARYRARCVIDRIERRQPTSALHDLAKCQEALDRAEAEARDDAEQERAA